MRKGRGLGSSTWVSLQDDHWSRWQMGTVGPACAARLSFPILAAATPSPNTSPSCFHDIYSITPTFPASVSLSEGYWEDLRKRNSASFHVRTPIEGCIGPVSARDKHIRPFPQGRGLVSNSQFTKFSSFHDGNLS